MDQTICFCLTASLQLGSYKSTGQYTVKCITWYTSFYKNVKDIILKACVHYFFCEKTVLGAKAVEDLIYNRKQLVGRSKRTN